jgi:hypothetical protein
VLCVSRACGGVGVEQGVDPAITKKEAKPDPNQNTFEFVAREWGTKQIPDFNEGKHYYRKTLERHVFPYIGTRAYLFNTK